MDQITTWLKNEPVWAQIVVACILIISDDPTIEKVLGFAPNHLTVTAVSVLLLLGAGAITRRFTVPAAKLTNPQGTQP